MLAWNHDSEFIATIDKEVRMRKRRHWIFSLLCILFLYSIMRSKLIIKDLQTRIKYTVYPKILEREHRSKLTFNSTMVNNSTMIKQYPEDTLSSSIECRRRKSKQFRLSAGELPLTALASPFRSGNTWVRHLLQMATGIGTSALYCDSELRFMGFPFECNDANYRKVLVVKTHEPRPPGPPKLLTVRSRKRVRERLVPQPARKNPPIDRAVVLIRDPYNYLVANMYSSHLDVVKEEEYFGDSKWRTALPGLLEWWIDFNDYWLRKFQGLVYPLLYSKLLTHTETELWKLMNFLNITYADSDIKCAIDNKEGNFHRKHFVWTRINDITELFNHTMKTKIDDSVKALSETLRTKYSIEWVNETHIVRVS
ncbi:WSC domain-containing protein 1-like isoform X2 [Mercenaria mercenaria]|uniref:WSC domain-containing protein 1-like isoform X2 n=1 Tax=Mercenaria mercenaria TaxID=6596 RepID=UPI00234F1254|nr:WSC domain-containing protein 1-like isoform X2 [Mercenaria mercenaria]